MRPFDLLPLLLAAASPSLGSPARHLGRDAACSEIPRLVIYYQTMHDAEGKPISLLPLVKDKGIALTHVNVASLHVNYNASGPALITINDNPPSDPMYDTMWAEAAVLQAAGVAVMGMVGGAARGSFNSSTLDAADEATFERAYAPLADVVRAHGLDGLDLDVEQVMSLAGVERLVRRLRADFGSGFIITLAPVATALLRADSNLSGFSYFALEADLGPDVAFYNGQFYNGFGSMATTGSFDKIVAAGWAPEKVVVGQLTAPANGYEYVSLETLNSTIAALRAEYGQIGGVMGWEYFNGDPGGQAEPWKWAEVVTEILRPGAAVDMEITETTARRLAATWRNSTVGAAKEAKAAPNVDYMSMVNA